MYKLTALEIKNAFETKKASAKEIADYFIHRIKTFDPKIGAFLHVFQDRIQKKASQLDQKKAQNQPLGKLAGIPIAIKDNIQILGEKTTCGSKILGDYKAVFDATVIKLLEQEDALLIGKTNLDEFAMGSSTEKSAFFPTNNPWDLHCVPGGSSGGSAAAVAARFSPIAFGSDTGGSIRQPAALCGIFGFKPTYGRVSRYGLVAFGSSLDQIGPLATTVTDIGLVMEVLGKHCKYDSTSLALPQETYNENLPENLKNTTIGVPFHFLENLKPETSKIFSQSLDTLKHLGAKIVDVDLDIFKYAVAIYYIVATAEASTNLARFDGIRYGLRSSLAESLDDIYDLSRDEGFGAEVKRRIMLGTYVLSSGFQNAYYKKAQKVRNLMIAACEKVFSTCDLIALPTSPSGAFKQGAKQTPIDMYLEDVFTIPGNLCGLPCISMPSGFDQEGKPLGIQLLGPQLHDVAVIRSAYAFEKATKFANKIPPLFDKEAKL